MTEHNRTIIDFSIEEFASMVATTATDNTWRNEDAVSASKKCKELLRLFPGDMEIYIEGVRVI